MILADTLNNAASLNVPLPVYAFGVLGGDPDTDGSGPDETAQIQAMFNQLSGHVNLVFGNRTYRFAGVAIPNTIKDLRLIFNNTKFVYPQKTGSDFWYRYLDSTGTQNAQISILGVPRISFEGTLVLDGEERLGNQFNQSGNPVVYDGRGLASVIYIQSDNAGLIAHPNWTKTGNTAWIVTNNGFTTNQIVGSFTSGKISFTRDPFYHYRVTFNLNVRAGTVYFNKQGTIANATTVSGNYSFSILASGPGKPTNQDFYFFGTIGTNADVTNIVVEKISSLYLDTYVKTFGRFTIKDHGFSAIRINSSSDLESYKTIELRDWTWDETVYGGHNIRGKYHKVWFDNFRVVDNYAKSWKGFVEEGARGSVISAVNTNDPNCWTDHVVVSNYISEKAALPGIISAKHVHYFNIQVNKWGKFVGADNIERNVSENDSTPYALPQPTGGQIFKMDLSLYSPETKLLIENLVCKNTSTYQEGNSIVWDNLWLQSGIQNALIRNSVFDSTVILCGTGDTLNSLTQSWAMRNHVDNCEFTETASLYPGYGSNITNCRFTRNRPSVNNVDLPFPHYTDTKLAVTINNTHKSLSAAYGVGNAFDEVLFKGCVFTARVFSTAMTNTIVNFQDCTFEEATNMTGRGNSINQSFDIKFFNCKRLVLTDSGILDNSHKANCKFYFQNCEIIIQGYSGNVNDLNDPTKSIRHLFDATSYKWDNLKIFDTSGNLLHDLNGFQWLKEPNNDYGIEGAYYETATNRYFYTGGKWNKK